MQMRNRIATASTVTCRSMTFAITANTTSVVAIGVCSAPTKTCTTIQANFPMHRASDMKGEPMDLIDRQQAIDAINELHDKPNAWLDLAVDVLEKLPSAQPESEHTMEEFMYGQDLGNPEDGSL